MDKVSVKLCLDELELCIYGYEKYRKVEDDSWAHVNWKISNYTLKFENSSYDLMCYEVDELRENIKTFLDGNMKDYKCFIPIEQTFKIRFYPKGDEYGVYYESLENKKLVEEPNMEIVVYPIMLDMTDIKKLYDYLVKITK